MVEEPTKPLAPDEQVGNGKSLAKMYKERQIEKLRAAYKRDGWNAVEPQIEDLINMSMYDHLTQLYTPGMFYELLKSIVLPRMLRNPKVGSIVYIDLNKFKEINAMFGHSGGDEILRVFAEMLKKQFREQDLIGRLGGDEFVVVAEELSPSFVEERVVQLLTAFAHHPWEIDCTDDQYHSVPKKFSFTYKVIEIDDPERIIELMNKADRAVMRQKRERDARTVKTVGSKIKACIKIIFGK